ncbi:MULTISPECIES: 50S ribosomal protein L9 [Auritidibacter]|uniref:50S ribosomal protein L9 n=1 Tax=Auritidibacter TaxID=1160973 RepID=UPI000D732181|nr:MULTISPECIES: 50S ribosomal protein L9 [unclassified Auritidibacter]AXR74504.1 50S ribosomal protein L9 [Auritidibacter sp. NML130574]PXA80665.1 50S ribosomal protein L9 [Auritidibacter sp. NML120636]
MAQQKLILTQEIPGLGIAGDVVEVKNGYARNYLIPRGFATRWTRGAENQVEEIRKTRAARAMANLEEAQALAEKLQQQPVQIQVASGETGRLFGSVTSSDIVEALEAAGHESIDRRNVVLTDSIRSLGNYSVQIRLHDDVIAQVELAVVPAQKKKK